MENKEKKKRLFEQALEGKFFDELNKDNFSRDTINKFTQEFEEHMTNLYHKYQLDFQSKEYASEIFKKIENYTSMSVANPRQVLIKSEKHLAECVTDCNLIPTGSFALDCLRNDKLCMDSIITYRERSKSLSDVEFLELYRASLEDAQKLAKEGGTMIVEYAFKINVAKENTNEDSYLEISDKNKPATLKLRIFLSNLNKKEKEDLGLHNGKFDHNIVHIKRVFSCFENYPEEFKYFRKLMVSIRIWREKSELQFLRTEILDMILLNEFVNNKGMNLSGNIQNCLMILDQEISTKRTLKNFGDFYMELYGKLNDEQKKKLSTLAGKSLDALAKDKYIEAQFS